MATKKQKRLEMQRRRAEFEADVKAEGLKAQELDKARRAAEQERMWEDAHKVHMKRNRFHDKCKHCAAIKARQALDKLAKAASKAKEPKVLSEEEARRMDEESTERVKGVLQEMGALKPANKEPANA